MSDNRKRPHIYRVTPEVDALIRAYADAQGCTPHEAAERLIERHTGTLSPLPLDLDRRITQRAEEKGQTREEALSAVLTVGLARLEALAKDAAKRRAGR